jgi:hypothetical protein
MRELSSWIDDWKDGGGEGRRKKVDGTLSMALKRRQRSSFIFRGERRGSGVVKVNTETTVSERISFR